MSHATTARHDNAEDMSPKRRFAHATVDEQGRCAASWTLTPVGLTDPVYIVAPPAHAVPIIFVPGIMGSNLKTTVKVDDVGAGQLVWLMDDEIGAFKTWFRRNPKQRQLRLNPKTTEVSNEGAIPSDVPTIGSMERIRTERFWGEVSAMSYQSFLVWLEDALNGKNRRAAWRGINGKTSFAGAVSPGYTFDELSAADLAHAANVRYPVYACGYNWLQSNMDSAKRLAGRIEQVIKANNTDSFACDQVILVTHSMGGLVARACSEVLGLRERIAGIVHGVMPTHGAPAAYRRVRAGTEGAAGYVLGDNAAKVSAVFANAPGALQLLPTLEYGPGWLQLGTSDERGSNFTPVASLPKADPYSEIYAQRGKWWNLMDEAYINPAKLKDHDGWNGYLTNLAEAKGFHASLAGRYHQNTSCFYGHGDHWQNGRTWGKVRWQAPIAFDITTRREPTAIDPRSINATETQLLSTVRWSDSGSGSSSALLASRYLYDFFLSEKDGPGDGTVPTSSGSAPGRSGKASGVQRAYGLNVDAFGHEGVYRMRDAQNVTLHSILCVTRDVKVDQ